MVSHDRIQSSALFHLVRGLKLISDPEIEYTMAVKTDELGDQASESPGGHWIGANAAFYQDPPLKNATNHLHQVLLQQYGHQPAFADGLGQIFGQAREGCLSTLRLLELGLLHVGKVSYSAKMSSAKWKSRRLTFFLRSHSLPKSLPKHMHHIFGTKSTISLPRPVVSAYDDQYTTSTVWNLFDRLLKRPGKNTG